MYVKYKQPVKRSYFADNWLLMIPVKFVFDKLSKEQVSNNDTD